MYLCRFYKYNLPLTTAFFLIQKGNTALHIASLAGHLNIVNLLVENGAKYDVQAHVSYHGNRSIDKPKRVLKEVCSDLGGNGLRFLWVCFVH